MWTDEDIPADITKRAQTLCAEGDALSEKDPATAIQRFSEAFKLLPEPKHRWLTATWILTAIGDTAFVAGDLRTATGAFREIALCEGWHTNPFVRLRRGQVAFENGELKQASNELASAFMLDGYRIFEREDEKYAEFVLSQMRPPVPPVDHPLARFHLQLSGNESKPRLPPSRGGDFGECRAALWATWTHRLAGYSFQAAQRAALLRKKKAGHCCPALHIHHQSTTLSG